MWERRCAVSADKLGVREIKAFERPSNVVGHFFLAEGVINVHVKRNQSLDISKVQHLRVATTKFELSLGKFVNLTGLERTFKSRGQNLTSRAPMT